MQRKIFIAIKFDGQTEKYIHQKTLILAKKVDAGWVSPDNYHLTISFLGYQNDETISELCSRLKTELFKTKAFDVLFDKLVWGPREDKIKMIWLQGQHNEKLFELRKIVDEITAKKELGKKTFKPHITLARLKKIQTENLDISALTKIKMGVVVSIDSVDVMESVSEKGETSFQIIDSTKLDL